MPELKTPRIVQVTINVTDLAESISFYRAAFNAAFNEDISSFIFGDPASPTAWVHLGETPWQGLPGHLPACEPGMAMDSNRVQGHRRGRRRAWRRAGPAKRYDMPWGVLFRIRECLNGSLRFLPDGRRDPRPTARRFAI